MESEDAEIFGVEDAVKTTKGTLCVHDSDAPFARLAFFSSLFFFFFSLFFFPSSLLLLNVGNHFKYVKTSRVVSFFS